MGLFRFLSGAPSEIPQKVPLHRVHLIVHPGDGLREDTLAAEETLLQEMAKRAITLEMRNEIAVVLLQMNEEELLRIRDPGYSGKERILATTLNQIEAGIPNNSIIVPNAPSVTYPSLDRALDDVQKQIAAHGFLLHQETEVLAYGEMVTKCVPQGAAYFAQHFGLNQTPIIDVNYTDALISDSRAQWERNGVLLGIAGVLNGNNLRYIPMGESRIA